MKVAICIPSRDIVHAAFAFDLANLAAYWTARNGAMGGSLHILNSTGTLIADQRVDLAKAAIDAGADWTLWLDTDMRFPKSALDRLLAHDKEIVGCNYSTRVVPPEPTATAFKDGEWVKVYTKPDSTGLEPVDFLGFGVTLVKTDVFKRLEAPWFHLGYSTVNNKFIGEDMYFCLKAKEAGVSSFIDHDLSKEIRHIGSFEFRHEHITMPEMENG
ncbi:putative glycosyltransferase [Caudoviricetes sp.]|nr:putative glycosyltransferase [Caudoviricetes sp.]